METVSEIMNHEKAHFNEAVRQGYIPTYALTFWKKDREVFVLPEVHYLTKPKGITTLQHHKAMMAVLTAPENPSDIDMKMYKEFLKKVKRKSL